MSIDPHAYNIIIRRDTFDGEILFEARVKELPDLTEYAESYEEAYSLAIDAIETTAEAFAEKGRSFPVAMVPVDDFSGRVTLRLPRSLHRVLVGASDSEGVSLNQHLVDVLSYHTGFEAGSQMKNSSAWRTMATEQETKRSHLRLVTNENLKKTANSSWS
jgi:predicted HicB family RNase H-like nuclease